MYLSIYIYVNIYTVNLFSIHILCIYGEPHKDAKFAHWEAEVASARHVFDFEACSLLFVLKVWGFQPAFGMQLIDIISNTVNTWICGDRPLLALE